MANCFRPLLPLAKRRTLAAHPLQPSATSEPRRTARLGTASCGRECHSGASTCSRSKKGELDPKSALTAVEQVQQREALGWSKGGFTTKIHLRCDNNGRPITFLLTVGERHEAVVFEALMEQGAVAGKGGGRPRLRPQRVVGDKGYSSGKIRSYLRRQGFAIRFHARTTKSIEESLTRRSTVSGIRLSGVSTV